MRVEHYIQELLYRYNCVVVPDFGAFLAHTSAAHIDNKAGTIYPPTKIISFNQQLSKNDGLLISHISKSKKLSYEDLLEEVQNVSKAWKTSLEKGNTIRLEGIGELTLNEEDRIQFIPENKTNYLASSFGLSAFAATPVIRETLKEEVVALEEEVPFIITPEQRKTYGIRPYLKYAAIGLVMLSLGLSGYQVFHRQNVNKQLVESQSKQQVEKLIQEATFFNTTPFELPSLSLKLEKKEPYQGPLHHIIAGAFRVRENADRKVAQLQREGYQARYIGANSYGLHQVAYASFSDNEAALDLYRKIKRTVSPDVWILSDK